MSVVAALIVAALFAVGTYLVLQRKLTRIIIGLGLLGHGANLLLLIVGGPAGLRPDHRRASPAATPIADPIPQALALTAIVIRFGVTAFLLALAYRSWLLTHDDEVEDDVEDRRIARHGSAATRRPPDADAAAAADEDAAGGPGERPRAAAGRAAVLVAALGPVRRSRAAQRAIASPASPSRWRAAIAILVDVDRDGPRRSPRSAAGRPPIGITLVADRFSALMLVDQPGDAAGRARVRHRPARRATTSRRSTRSTWCSPPVVAVVPHRRPVQPVRRRSRSC